jgi:acyl-CoA thioester hydrolase
MIRAEVTVRAEFFDVDPMRVVWHGNYVKYLELARNALLESIDYGYRRMSDEGWAFPVVDLRLRYHRPILLGQEVRVSAELKEWENRLVLDFEIRDLSGAILTRATSTQVAVRLGEQELSFLCPPGLRERVERALEPRP